MQRQLPQPTAMRQPQQRLRATARLRERRRGWRKEKAKGKAEATCAATSEAGGAGAASDPPVVLRKRPSADLSDVAGIAATMPAADVKMRPAAAADGLDVKAFATELGVDAIVTPSVEDLGKPRHNFINRCYKRSLAAAKKSTKATTEQCGEIARYGHALGGEKFDAHEKC